MLAILDSESKKLKDYLFNELNFLADVIAFVQEEEGVSGEHGEVEKMSEDVEHIPRIPCFKDERSAIVNHIFMMLQTKRIYQKELDAIVDGCKFFLSFPLPIPRQSPKVARSLSTLTFCDLTGPGHEGFTEYSTTGSLAVVKELFGKEFEETERRAIYPGAPPPAWSQYDKVLKCAMGEEVLEESDGSEVQKEPTPMSTA